MDSKIKLSEETSSRWSVFSLFGAKPKAPAASAAPAAAPAHKPVVPTNGHRILVVDDDEVVRKSTEMKLKARGYAVSTAADGPSAIHAARSEKPDLILLDLNFPPDVSLTWDGFGILSWLRRLDVTKNIPVIIVTGNHEKNLDQRAQAAGAAGLFNKPLNFEPLVSLIELRLKSRAAASPNPVTATSKD